MNLENLSIGMKIPNYKKLCELLDIPVKAGNSKAAQLQELSRYFSFTREGNAYAITEVKETPTPYQDGRQRYVSLIEPILMNNLSYSRCDDSGLPWHKWYTLLGMVSRRLYDEQACAKAVDNNWAHSYSLYKLKNITSQKLKSILISSLNNMQNRDLIRYETLVGIVSNRKSWRASPDEQAYIEDVKLRVMADMGVEKISSIFLSPTKSKEYNDKTHKIISAETSWRYSYNGLYIEPISNHVASAYFDLDVDPLKDELKTLVHNTVISAARTEYYRVADKQTELWCTDTPEADEALKHCFSYPRNYLADIELLANDLLL